MPLKRIYLSENSDIRFEIDEKTGETVMFVCGQPFTKRKLPVFSERIIRKQFRNEIEQHKNFVCPTELGEEKPEA